MTANKHFTIWSIVSSVLTLLTIFSVGSVGWGAPAKAVGPQPSDEMIQWTVAQDGTGEYLSIQEAIDAAQPGQTIRIKSGNYEEDVTVHSKDNLKIIGQGMDKVKLSGLKRVGTLHIGKWPYGAKNVEIHGLTVMQHGGLGIGIFNGEGILLKHVRVHGMVFGQQVQDARLVNCLIGGSETTGVSFADSKAILTENFIHDNDHGVAIGGTSQVLLEQNVITRSLLEAVMVTDEATVKLIRNTLVRNGGGVTFQDSTQGEVHGNILAQSKIGFLFSPNSRTTLSYNVLYANTADYLLNVSPKIPAPKRRGPTDIKSPPSFVNPDQDDFRLQPNTALLKIGGFPFLGALAPVDSFQ